MSAANPLFPRPRRRSSMIGFANEMKHITAIIGAIVVAVAGAGIVSAVHTVNRVEHAHATARARATDAEARIERACNDAATSALLTLRALRTTPDIGFALAQRDASMTRLCGGDGAAVTTAVLADDVGAAFVAVLALYDTWCPACATRRLERLQEPRP